MTNKDRPPHRHTAQRHKNRNNRNMTDHHHHRSPPSTRYDQSTRTRRDHSPDYGHRVERAEDKRYRNEHRRRPSPSYERGPEGDDGRGRRQERRLTPELPLGSNSRHQQGSENRYIQGGRDDFFERRRLERENSNFNFWPRSPDRAYEDTKTKKGTEDKKKTKDSHSKKKSSKKKKSKYDSEDSSSSSSEEEDRKKKSKNSKKRRKDDEREEEKRLSKKEKSSNKRKHEREDSTDSDRSVRRSKFKEEEEEEEEDLMWEEKKTNEIKPAMSPKQELAVVSRQEEERQEDRAQSLERSDSDDVDDTVGPMPYNPMTGKAMDPKEFGRALRPGEGSAMAAFIEAGERIPRRGEIGLTGTQIEKFEQAGYVMSGSRHRRMNAVRIRKENQVISAEEKRGILKMQAEEKQKREGQIISSFRELVDTKLQETS